MLTLSANTRTPRPRGIAKTAHKNAAAAGSWAAAARSVCALVLVFALMPCAAPETLAQSSHSQKKQKKVKKPAPVPCRIGCKPDTAAPGVTEDTPEDQVLRKELSGLAREVHNGAPGAYNNLSAFASKNAANVWGARAALAAALHATALSALQTHRKQRAERGKGIPGNGKHELPA